MPTHDQQILIEQLQSAQYVYTADGLWFGVWCIMPRNVLQMRHIDIIICLDLVRMGILVKGEDDNFYLAKEYQ